MANSAPALSILLPTFNGEAHLGEQLRSILDQSFGNFELLIADDGSIDETPAIARNFSAMDGRIRIVPAAGNVGHKNRLLELLRAARGPLISIADQDDLWHQDKTRLLVEALDGHGLAYGRSDLVDAAARPLGKTLIGHFGAEPRPDDRLTLLFVPRVSGHAMIARREVVSEMAFRRYQSFDLLVALDAAFSSGIVYVDDAIVYHRLHGENQTNASVGLGLPRARRWTAGRLYAEVQSPRRDRFNLLGRLEHLACSSVIRVDEARLFSRAASLCRNAWYLPGAARPISGRQLRSLLADILEPLSGSQQDWLTAKRHLARLSRSAYGTASLWEAVQAWSFG
jgi:glycosyltransferase involved in cell wall biosynthesis